MQPRRLKEDERELVRYEKARKKPYFGRIDFRDPKAKADEAYYIGRVGITDSALIRSCLTGGHRLHQYTMRAGWEHASIP